MSAPKYVVGRRRNGGIIVQGVKAYKSSKVMTCKFGEEEPDAVVALRSIELPPIPKFNESLPAAKLRAAYLCGAADQPWEEIAELVTSLIVMMDYSTLDEKLATQIEEMLDLCETHIGQNANYSRLTCVRHRSPSDMSPAKLIEWWEAAEVPDDSEPFPIRQPWKDEQIELPIVPGEVIPFLIREQIACARNWGLISVQTMNLLMDAQARSGLSEFAWDEIIAMVSGTGFLEKLVEWLNQLKGGAIVAEEV